MTDFIKFGLRDELLRAIGDLGYTQPTPIQSEVIPLLLAGRDVIGQAKTGTGKTAAFALPILQRMQIKPGHVQVLVLAPTRELALQVARAFEEYGRHMSVRTLAVYGGQPYAPQINKLNRGVDTVVGTPGRLIDLIEKKALDLSAVNTLVLDEADEMLSMGFIEDIEKILSSVPAERQTALFSATMPNEIRKLAARYMHRPETIAVGSEEMTVSETEQTYYLVYKKDKLAALSRLFETEQFGSTLVFVRTRADSSNIANQLTSRGYTAEALNGDLTQEARERTLERFRQGKVKVLVATDVAARGLDIEGISHVVNYELPEVAEAYVHRIGRTGRAGRSGAAISIVAPSERNNLRQIERFTRHPIKLMELPSDEQIRKNREEKLLEDMQTWLKRGRCRAERKLIERLVEEGNYDVYDVAAAALKLARAEEKQRPVEAVEPVLAREKRERPRPDYFIKPKSADRFDAREAQTASHEAGMTRLRIEIGKLAGIRPADIVGAIAGQYNLVGSRIGKIKLLDDYTLVDVPNEIVPVILKRGKPIFIRKQPIQIQKAG